MLVKAPAFTAQLMTGYADVPLAVFSATGLTLLAGWFVRPRPALLPLASVFLAAAALSKNEGLFVILAAGAAVVATGLVTRGLRAVVPALAATAASALPLLPWQLYVARHDLRTGLYETSALTDPGELAERADRLGPAVSALLGTLANPLAWALAASLFVVLVVLAYVAGTRRLAVFGTFWVGAMAAQLLLADWIANTPLEWHLATSKERVAAPLAVGMAVLAPLLVGSRAEETGRDDPLC